METYPSISDCIEHENVYGFLKYDGSNLRVEWTPKRGFDKFGTRKRLFDKSDPVFGGAIDIFNKMWAKDLDNVIRRNKYYQGAQKITFFFEYFGEKSFAGKHVSNDEKMLVLIDVKIHKKNYLEPKLFIEHFDHIYGVAELVWKGKLSEEFLSNIENSTDLGSIYRIRQPIIEGVVFKRYDNKRYKMFKVKTYAWKQHLKEVFPLDWQKYI